MLTSHLRILAALKQANGRAIVPHECGASDQAEVADAIAAAEREFGRTVLRSGRLTEEGRRIADWACAFLDDYGGLQRDLRPARRRLAVAPMLGRRSVSPKRLVHPGPGAGDLDLILEAALRAPDHGALQPWRVIEFAPESRQALADLFEAEKLRRDPLASDGDRQRAREHATRAPTLLAFVVSPRMRSKVPVREQWLAAGAALGNLLNAAHQLGFGAIALSGERCFDAALCAELAVGAEEFLAAFVSIGTVVEMPTPRPYPPPTQVMSRWESPAVNAARAMPSTRSDAPGSPP